VGLSNINGVQRKRCELEQAIADNELSVVCLNETRIREARRGKVKWPKGFDVFDRSRPGNAAAGGVAILTANELRATPVEMPPIIGATEAIACEITTGNRSPIGLLCIYSRGAPEPGSGSGSGAGAKVAPAGA
jgi:exonuclease III